MKQLLFTLFCLFAYSSLQAQAVPTDELYGVGIWNADSLGNHRVIVSVDKPADAVLATIDWRRRDLNPEAKNLIVVDAATGERIMYAALLSTGSRERWFSSRRLFRENIISII